MTIRPLVGALILLAAMCLGCQRQVELQYVSSKEVLDLSGPLQQRVREILDKNCGTPVRPKLLGDESADVTHLRRGAAIYQKRCVACHGATGDGNGEAAAYLSPRPRDYRRGIFKFTSTPYGAKPRREDLRRTLRHGAKGTSMPSFAQLPEDELEAVLDYVLVLTHRGELELQLAVEADNEDEISDEALEESITMIVGQWKEAKQQAVWPLTKMPLYSEESVALGKKAFLTEEAGCYKCHGSDGRGRTTDNAQGFNDVWGVKTRAADLTAGMFHGGNRPEDIYRRIFSGINGTPMPSFEAKLSKEPDTFWHLVHYVQFISSARRRTLNPEP
ncbi:MAG TPA: c-type cytochrome [Pirellulales bacterium]|nr:c-type cytochrome [Pirellulales bacterium]